MSSVDLHTHSICSDGVLAPADLVARAADCGVGLLALTDHDTTAGLEEAEAAARQLGIGFVPGVELSARYGDQVVHVVGLGIGMLTGSLRDGLARQQAMRAERAEEIGRRLASLGLEVAERARALAGPGQVTRTHFARALVEGGHVREVQEGFDRYLGRGRPAYVRAAWATLEEAVAWITAAGGIAVLAHPARYHLSGRALRGLLAAFKTAGGRGIEVATGNGSREDLNRFAQLAREFGLLASAGSDFHDPGQHWIGLGRLPVLPADLSPVWDHGLRSQP